MVILVYGRKKFLKLRVSTHGHGEEEKRGERVVFRECVKGDAQALSCS